MGDYSHSLVIPSAAAGILATPRKISEGDYVVSLHDPHFCARGTVLNTKESLRFAQTSFLFTLQFGDSELSPSWSINKKSAE